LEKKFRKFTNRLKFRGSKLFCHDAGEYVVYCVKGLAAPVEEAKDMKDSLFEWISRERFVAFPKVTGVGLNEMASLGKLLAVFVLDEKDSNKVEKSR